MDAPDEMVEAALDAIEDARGVLDVDTDGIPESQWRVLVGAVLSVPALAEVIARASELEADLAKVVDERDEAQGWADRLAAVAGGPEVIGEHSNMNNPWANALDLLKAKGR